LDKQSDVERHVVQTVALQKPETPLADCRETNGRNFQTMQINQYIIVLPKVDQ